MLRTTPQASAPTGSRGFSLVELVVVMAVAGILAATIAPRFFTQSTFSERGYADELASALRAAQKAAVVSGCPAQLTLSLAGYAAAQQAASGNACLASDSTWSTPLLGADGVAVQGAPPSGVTVSPTGVFQFDTQGRLASSPGSTITIGTRAVVIDAGSGYVQVQ
jgi:MSHA pilin protein MshC